MESNRCKLIIKDALHELGINYKTLELGEVDLKRNISDEKLQLFNIALRNAGFELIDNKNNLYIEKIKASIQSLIYHLEDGPKTNFSNYISEKVNRDYTYLSNLFSGVMGVTIEKYIITRKIEYVKELLVYNNLTISDIAFRLQYSSEAHLSNQFKKITGLTISHYRKLRNIKHPKI
jgi:YesN/AraC family two-component response regulator